MAARLEYMQGMLTKYGPFDWQRLVPLTILGASVCALAVAYSAEVALSLETCVLCLYQRVPYVLAGVLGLAALLVPRGRLRAAAAVAAGGAFLTGAGIAFYHVGVEQHWWVSAVSCSGDLSQGLKIQHLQQQLLKKPPKACDDVDWMLFGVSMATYNVAASLIFGVASFWGARQLRETT